MTSLIKLFLSLFLIKTNLISSFSLDSTYQIFIAIAEFFKQYAFLFVCFMMLGIIGIYIYFFKIKALLKQELKVDERLIIQPLNTKLNSHYSIQPFAIDKNQTKHLLKQKNHFTTKKKTKQIRYGHNRKKSTSLISNVSVTSSQTYTMNMINEIRNELTEQHQIAIDHLFEVIKFQETKAVSMHGTKEQYETLKTQQNKCLERIYKNIRHYLSYSVEKRKIKQKGINQQPCLWLNSRIQHHTQHLIDTTKFIYDDLLLDFMDHQKFIVHKLEQKNENDFKSINPD